MTVHLGQFVRASKVSGTSRPSNISKWGYGRSLSYSLFDLAPIRCFKSEIFVLSGKFSPATQFALAALTFSMICENSLAEAAASKVALNSFQKLKYSNLIYLYLEPTKNLKDFLEVSSLESLTWMKNFLFQIKKI